jgi:hypothetical protein
MARPEPSDIPDLTPGEPEAREPRLLFSCRGGVWNAFGLAEWYVPSQEGSPHPRIVATWRSSLLGVWDSVTGRHLADLRPRSDGVIRSLITYRLVMDQGPRIACGTQNDEICVWDGDEYGLLFSIPLRCAPGLPHLVAYLDPRGEGSSRLACNSFSDEIDQNEISVLDGETGALVRVIPISGSLWPLGSYLSADGQNPGW